MTHAQSCSEFVGLRRIFSDTWGRTNTIASVDVFSSRKSRGLEIESLTYSRLTKLGGSYLQFRNPGTRRTRFQSVQARSPPKAIDSSFSLLSCRSKSNPSTCHKT